MSPPAKFLSLLVRLYQIMVSPVLHFVGGPGSGCRFDPTCSQYMLDALRTHGAARGSWLGLRRIVRCHPWGGFGHDPVPPAKGCISGATADNTRSSDSHPQDPPPADKNIPRGGLPKT